jgi:photosystem II stability/assembly factor-like uncharacterized protein
MNKSPLLLFLFTLLLGGGTSNCYAQKLVPLPFGPDTSIRGLSVVNDAVAWISGSKGWTSVTTDAGKTWNWRQLPAYDSLDFRDIEAFSSERAVMVSAGSPAVVLLTTDGGKNWKEVYRNNSPEIFLDGMDFWDDLKGIIYGDPIAGRLQLLQTQNGGLSWQPISGNLNERLQEGEASFAASGTAIRALQGGHAWIATGGVVSRIFHSADYGQTWESYALPIIQGKSSTGPFSIAFLDPSTGVAAGGDYRVDTLRRNNFLLTSDGGKSWQAPKSGPLGYRSAVEYITRNALIATGTSGTDISRNGGKTWSQLSPEGYHTVRKAKKGNWVVLTGAKGRIATLRFE